MGVIFGREEFLKIKSSYICDQICDHIITIFAKSSVQLKYTNNLFKFIFVKGYSKMILADRTVDCVIAMVHSSSCLPPPPFSLSGVNFCRHSLSILFCYRLLMRTLMLWNHITWAELMI